MMYSAYKLNKQDNNIHPRHTPFPILEQFAVPCLILSIASWPAFRFPRNQVRWSGIPISLKIFHSFFLWFTQSKVLVYSMRKKWMFFWSSLSFPMIQQLSAIWVLILLSFLNQACISGSSWFLYCWRLAWRILNITLLACEMNFLGGAFLCVKYNVWLKVLFFALWIFNYFSTICWKNCLA